MKRVAMHAINRLIGNETLGLNFKLMNKNSKSKKDLPSSQTQEDLTTPEEKEELARQREENQVMSDVSFEIIFRKAPI